jgi:hypothetical protein
MIYTKENIQDFLTDYADEVYEMPFDKLEILMYDHVCVKWEDKEYFVCKDNSNYTDDDDKILDFLRHVTDVISEGTSFLEDDDTSATGFAHKSKALHYLSDLLWDEGWEDHADGDDEMIAELLDFIGARNYDVNVQDRGRIEVVYNDALDYANAETDKYKKAYNVLMDYFEELSEESKSEIHEKLEKLDL